MPYIITTGLDGQDTRYHSRRAVATLDEAREVAGGIVKGTLRIGGEPRHDRLREIAHLPEAGSTVGPLPDGTVVQVKRVTWRALDVRGAEYDHDDHEIIIANYNAAQGA